MSKSIGKQIILQFKHSNSTTDREVSELPGQLGKTDKKSEYFPVSKGISNSTQKVDQKKNKPKPKQINLLMQEKAEASLEVENLVK